MHTSSSRLVCHASNRFSPAIALQEYFIAPTPPNAVQRRLSSNVSSTEQAKLPPTINAEEVVVEDGDVQPTPTVEQAQRPRPTWTPKMSKGQEHVRISLNVYSAAEKFNIRKIHRDIKVQPGSLVAADLHRTQLLQAARSAFETFTDYEGRKIRPLRIPRGYNEKDLPWVVPNKEQYTSGLDRLNAEIERFYQHVRPDHIESRARKQIIEEVKRLVQSKLQQGTTLEVYGSERTGLALATSDIDLRLAQQQDAAEFEASLRPISTRARRKTGQQLGPSYNALAKSKEFILVTRRRNARFPLIHMQHRRSGVEVQIVSSPDTLMSREIMTDYMEQFPFIRPLFAVVKATLDVRGLTDVFQGGIGSYTLFMMLVAVLKLAPPLTGTLGVITTRQDPAGALLTFLRFFGNFDTTRYGISIDPKWIFEKEAQLASSRMTVLKTEQGDSRPLPSYMLRLRDPADPTNDLGRKAFAIKHVQSTIRSLYHGLVIAVKQNERPSLLDILVGVKPGLDKARRQKLRNAGREMETQLAESLAAKAKRLREAEDSATLAELDQASEMTTSVSEQMRQDDEKRRIVRELRDRSWHDLTAERNKQLRPAAEKFATAAGIDVTKVDMDEFGSRYRTKWQINDSAVGESKPAETEGDQILSFLEDEQSTKKAEIPQIEVEHLAEEEASMDSTLADKT